MTTASSYKLWGRKQIADYFDVSLKTVDKKIIAAPDFPKPVTIPHVHKRWIPKDIEKWVEEKRRG